MVDEARRQVAESGGAERAAFLQADLMDLSSLPAEHFHLATAMGEPIGSAADPAQTLKQVARLLAPGGVLVATFDNRAACIDHYVEQGDARELEAFLRTGRTNWLTRDPSEQFQVHAFTPEQLEKLTSAAGLEVLEMLGKTVLPMRRHRELLADSEERRRWAVIEKQLARDPHNFGRCPHLQLTARKA